MLIEYTCSVHSFINALIKEKEEIFMKLQTFRKSVDKSVLLRAKYSYGYMNRCFTEAKSLQAILQYQQNSRKHADL